MNWRSFDWCPILATETFRMHHDKDLDIVSMTTAGKIVRYIAYSDGITSLAITEDGSKFGGVVVRGNNFFVELR